MKKVVKKIAKKTLGDAYDKAVLPKHYGVAIAANLRRRFPARGLKVIGVTGTNGKTTTVHLIHQMLWQAGYNTGLMTTVAYGLNEDIKPQVEHMTSQRIEVLLNRIVDMKKGGLDWLVLEVTSQALSQFRLLGVPIDIAVMTNVTHEHLDYHGTFQRYLQAKLKLFKLARRNRQGRQLGIVNIDDENGVLFADAVKNVIAYSMDVESDSNIATPHNIHLDARSCRYTLKIDDDQYKIVCNLPGSFNVTNSMAAALVGRAIGLTGPQIENGIKTLKEVEGRMMSIDEGQKFSVIIDFAHTPDSFEKLFADIKPLVKGRLISVFGSAGRRDRLKRPLQGKTAGEYSDIVILTEEDNRDIDGQKIMQQIAKGATKARKVLGKDLLLIADRADAIETALRMAKPDDTVLLLGKGHEKTIERADGEHPWDEIGLTRRLLGEIKLNRQG